MDAGVLNSVATNRAVPESRQEFIQSIEMQQNPVANSTPVLSSQTVITAQPQGGAQQPRRPLPVNTLDWVSTPRTQLNVLSGTHFLGNVEQLEIQQIVDLSTLLGKTDRRFQYRVKVPRAETLFLAMSTSGDGRRSNWNSTLFRSDFSFIVLDQSGETAFTMTLNSRWTYTLKKLRKITVESTSLIGTVEEHFSIIGSCFTVYDSTRKELCNIYGPNVCGCCMYQEAQFQAISMDGTHQIASLMHQWDNTLHDYVLLVTFPAEIDITLKSLLLGATFLLEYMYFERVKRVSS